MRYTSIRKWVGVTAAVVGCVALAPRAARAATYNFTEGDAYYLGVVTPDGGSPTTEATEVNDLAAMTPGTTQTIDYGQPAGSQDFTRSSNTLCFSNCPDVGAELTANSTGTNSGTLASGATYLIAKYDNAQAGMYVWYVAGLTGTFTVPTTLGTCGSTGCGLSHWIVFGGTGGGETGGGTGGGETGGGTGGGETGPEPASLLLFGAALGAAALRMKRRPRLN